MSPGLTLSSETYSPFGNLAAEGFRKLLGAPTLDLVQTVVREAVQNSCDAARGADGIRVLFRVRQLSMDNMAALRTGVFRELPASPDSRGPLEKFLAKSSPWVLEICDFGKKGLGGPTRADVVPSPGDRTDFVDFLRNVGSARDTEQGGGTYGYGKTSLYLSSGCSTIIVDTQSTHGGSAVRRLMACHLGAAYQASDGVAPRKYTGRHWWGVPSDGEFVEPLQDAEAEQLSAQLGFPTRTRQDSGTTIAILDPSFLEDDSTSLARAIQESILWHFWPRMLASTPRSRSATFTVELNGKILAMPQPEQFAPLNLFAEALGDIRAQATSVSTLRCEKPKCDLGSLRIVKGMHGIRQWLRPPESSLIPPVSFHIAVMRPVELVVRYFSGEPFAGQGSEWAGVFVSSSDPSVESAFAAAEPPAHDDWQPSLLPKGAQRTYVNVALSRLRQAAKAVAPASATLPEGESGPSLAAAARALGRALDAWDGEGDDSGSSRRRKRYRTKFAPPRFQRLELGPSGPVAIFSTTLRPGVHPGEKVRLRAAAAIVIDGAVAREQFDGSAPPAVEDWKTRDGRVLGRGSEVEVPLSAGTIDIAVAIPGDAAVGLTVEVQPTGEEF